MGIRVTKKSKTEFAAKLKAWRKREGISQSQAAERLNIPVRTLQNWEIARTKPARTAERFLSLIIAPPKPKRAARRHAH